MAELPLSRRTDVATSAVIRESQNSIVREMRRAMVQSSYSSIIYEGYDFSCVLIDGQGRLIAESGEDHPFHIIPVAGAVQGALAIHGAIGAHDILLHNDPYTGGTHLNDVAVIWPVHEGGRPIFHVVVRSHWGDIGGMTPGSLNGAATDILQEGLRLNYLKARQGRPLRDPAADLRQCPRNDRGERRFPCRARHLPRGRTAAARPGGKIRAGNGCKPPTRTSWMPPNTACGQPSAPCRAETYRHVGYSTAMPPRRTRWRFMSRLTIGDGELAADFSGSSLQVAAPLNAGPAIAPTSVMTVIKSFLDPRGPITSGTLRAITVTAPPGTIVNARSPAPCGGLNEVRFGCDAALMGALGKAIPDRMTGDVRGTSNHTYIGDRSFIFYEYPSGGTGAWADP